jgi:hypothetical protein
MRLPDLTNKELERLLVIGLQFDIARLLKEPIDFEKIVRLRIADQDGD